jgi:cytochrome c peroxidase
MKKIIYACLAGLVLSILAVSCQKELSKQPTPNGNFGPALPEEPFEYGLNSVFGPSISDEKITLGRVLFYDKALSFNNSISCGSCHFQRKGFADNTRFHKGIFGNVLKRNTLSITGSSNNLFWDGRVNSMKDLVLRPIANHEEMVQDPNMLVTKLSQLPYYNQLFTDAYGNSGISLSNIEDALASFCMALDPKNSKFQKALLRHTNGLPATVSNPAGIDLYELSLLEKQGMKLFYTKARCGTCHKPEQNGSGYFTSFANIGLDINYADPGVGSLPGSSNLNGVFKIPNLKNVALTAPYMHDGRFSTLEQVIDHYNHGIKPNPNLSIELSNLNLETIDSLQNLPSFSTTLTMNGGLTLEPIKLGLSVEEKAALKAFLLTLTDEEITRDIKFSDPF